ncbi:hypothetical protein A3J33_02010 [candidate division WWE3 bacterium RIFCSPLOWO2_02_FULL_53_10]|uniref:DUF58 domain-containing protein n=2 Tax=Katanobacteria TaxID=422282 RepID=A0A1F4W2G1_UNCKA|nr:MAG: hypothetical protein A2890_01095 [candidate division WWE3 bacterium RIFCSPLOWO2_01_FULL_53_14]OGC63560.1 MAG: hypothetical protein A3J33_02010 [candidate division WWE3 bacterium RIFCSPLOWO2_02_FULL_53_10]
MKSNPIELRLEEIRYWIRWLSRSFAAGRWNSYSRGRGFDFQGIAPFREDPDMSRINQKATLASGELHVSQFSEERNASILLLANVGPSMAFGSAETKMERLALLAAIFSYSAYRAKDYFRFVGYTDEVELGFPKPRDRSYPIMLAEAILNFDWRGKKRGGLVRAVAKVPKKKSLVVIISDHLGKLDGTERALQALVAAGHEVLSIILWDERETKFPDGWGFLPLQDLETGEIRHVLVNARSRRILERNIAERKKEIEALFRRFGIQPHFFSQTSEEDLASLVQIFMALRTRV